VSAAPQNALTRGEVEILIDGLSDDVSFQWALIHLGIHGNPRAEKAPPSTEEIAAAFASFERLVAGGLAKLGRIESVGPAPPPGSLASVKLVQEPIRDVRERAERECRSAKHSSDWTFCCWLVNTEAGNALARLALAQDADRYSNADPQWRLKPWSKSS
jgi:hypothetical protein